jgi:uncharacterized membrane protein YgcG
MSGFERGNRLIRICVFSALSIFLSVSCFAQGGNGAERIRLFHGDISVNRDASMTVTETITVNCTGEVIKRGIYRDFPTTYRNRFNDIYRVRFEVLDVRRDGSPEPFHIQQLDNGVRIYIGRSDRYLSPGEYSYTLTYKTTRQIGFYKQFDELYWNVTGNGWVFPIDEASASVSLPDGALWEVINIDGYTGAQGARDRNFSVSTDIPDRIVYKTTRPLAREEGLTIVVNWPKGYVREPDLRTELGYFLDDNRGIAAGIAGLLVILGYYVYVWMKVGRDPAKGTIIPLYAPPEKLSPADIRYIMHMGYDNKVFTAAVINMAVKKYLNVAEEGGVYTVKKTQTTGSDLSDEEEIIARILFAGGESIRLTNLQHAVMRRAAAEVQLALKRSFEKNYFLTNKEYFIPGILLSVILMAVTSVFKSGGMVFASVFMSIWLTVWTFGVVTLLSAVFQAWRACLAPGNNARPVIIGAAVFTTFFSIPFVAGEIFGIIMFVSVTSPAVFIILCGAVFINVLFYHLLKAPTVQGRRIMDRIEGFKMFLSVAEKDRLQALHPVAGTPELFERYLPYALALGVEQAWAEKFAGVLARAQTGESTAAGYAPSWYHGAAGTFADTSGFVSAFGNSFAGAIASSSSAPGSGSGGGGGGSSGGGGGGGGGGGW